MHRAKTGLILGGLLALLLLAACQRPTTLSQSYLQFGTLIEITLADVEQEQAMRAFDAVGQLLERRHSDWHGWLDGDLSRFNRALLKDSSSGVSIPPSLQRLIAESNYYYELSERRFDVGRRDIFCADFEHKVFHAAPPFRSRGKPSSSRLAT